MGVCIISSPATDCVSRCKTVAQMYKGIHPLGIASSDVFPIALTVPELGKTVRVAYHCKNNIAQGLVTYSGCGLE